jgi:ABC-type glycerol-3-phosphate transport system permease component
MNEAFRLTQRGILYVALILLAGAFLVPLVLIIATAVSPENGSVATTLVPRGLTFDNFNTVLHQANFGRLALNSVVATAASTAAVVLIASLAAFGLVEYPFPGSRLVLLFLLAGIMLAPAVVIAPLYQLVISLHLLNNYLGLIGPYTAFGLPVSILLFRNAFAAVPRELGEAATVDGASSFKIYWRVYMPISRPSIATVVILQVLLAWNDYLISLLVMTKSSMQTVQLAYTTYAGQFYNEYGKQFAVLTLVMLPVIVVFVAFQRQFIRGLTGGAVKG